MKRKKMTKHNKKRNIGIVYELLLRHISNSLIENDISSVKKTTKIIEKHLNKSSDLFKEFRLVNALINSDVRNTEVAAAIMTEAKDAARRSDPDKIDKAKSRLIRDINHTLKDRSFYYRNIPNYVDYANVQNLINEWRKGDKSDFKKMIQLERKVMDVLLQSKNNANKDIYQEKKDLEASQSDKLVVKIMTEKINQKYQNMSVEQKEIIKNYALYSNIEDSSKLSNFLKEQKAKCLDRLEKFSKINNNEFIKPKIKNVREKIVSLNENSVNDDTIMKFMTVSKLIDELGGK